MAKKKAGGKGRPRKRRPFEKDPETARRMIRELMDAEGIGIPQIVERAGVSRNTASKMVNHPELTTIDNAERLARCFESCEGWEHIATGMTFEERDELERSDPDNEFSDQYIKDELDAKELLSIFFSLSDRRRAALLDTARSHLVMENMRGPFEHGTPPIVETAVSRSHLLANVKDGAERAEYVTGMDIDGGVAESICDELGIRESEKTKAKRREVQEKIRRMACESREVESE